MFWGEREDFYFDLQVDIDEEQAALLLQKTLKGRSVQLRMLKGRARKQDLIDAMTLENPITAQDAEIVNKRELEGRRAQLEQESLQSKEDYINSFLDRLEGETLGKMLDYLSQELTDSATVVGKGNSDMNLKLCSLQGKGQGHDGRGGGGGWCRQERGAGAHFQ